MILEALLIILTYISFAAFFHLCCNRHSRERLHTFFIIDSLPIAVMVAMSIYEKWRDADGAKEIKDLKKAKMKKALYNMSLFWIIFFTLDLYILIAERFVFRIDPNEHWFINGAALGLSVGWLSDLIIKYLK